MRPVRNSAAYQDFLQLEEQARLSGRRARQESLVFRRIELSVCLELGRLHELWGRAEPCRLKNFVVCNGNPTPPVFLDEKGVRHELVVCLVLEAVSLVEADALIARLRRLLFQVLRGLVPGGGEYVLSVDGGDGGSRSHRRASEQTRSLGEQKTADEQYDDDDPDVFCGGPHCLQQGHYSLREMD